MAEEFTPKEWHDANVDGTLPPGVVPTKTDADGMIDLEQRLATYTDLRTQFVKADLWSVE